MVITTALWPASAVACIEGESPRDCAVSSCAAAPDHDVRDLAAEELPQPPESAAEERRDVRQPRGGAPPPCPKAFYLPFTNDLNPKPLPMEMSVVVALKLRSQSLNPYP